MKYGGVVRSLLKQSIPIQQDIKLSPGEGHNYCSLLASRTLLIYLAEAERCLHGEALALGSVRVSSISFVIHWLLSITHFCLSFFFPRFLFFFSFPLSVLIHHTTCCSSASGPAHFAAVLILKTCRMVSSTLPGL